MNADQMRQFVANEYPGERWQNRVRSMTDSQVFAIYSRILSKKKLTRVVVFG